MQICSNSARLKTLHCMSLFAINTFTVVSGIFISYFAIFLLKMLVLTLRNSVSQDINNNF